MRLPSGEYVHAFTALECPARVTNSAPDSAFQSFRVLSHEAETMRLPSGEYAQALTVPKCLASVIMHGSRYCSLFTNSSQARFSTPLRQRSFAVFDTGEMSG